MAMRGGLTTAKTTIAMLTLTLVALNSQAWADDIGPGDLGSMPAAAVVPVALAAAPSGADAMLGRPRVANREIVSRRTAFSETWTTPSGARVTRVSPGPIRWRDGSGDLQPFD